MTITPLDLPALAYHGGSLESAEEDLCLAIDDRIGRAHPRHVAAYARNTRGELRSVSVDAMTVWHAGGQEVFPMRMNLVVAAAHKPFVEVRSPRLDLRVWLPAGDDLMERAAPYFLQHLVGLPETERLALRTDGDEALRDLTVDAEPAPLSTLKRRELHLDERPPPLPDDMVAPPSKKKKSKRDDDGFDEDRKSVV